MPHAIASEGAKANRTLIAPASVKPAMLAVRAPRKIPGQKRGPINNKAASPMPDGGHTGETLVPGNAMKSPARAAQ